MRNVKYIDIPVGRLLLAVEKGFVVELSNGVAKEADCFETTELLEDAEEQLLEYFRGERTVFELPLQTQGTDFRVRVWDALKKIPYGEVISYGEVAKKIGCPGGARAVGQACNKNPIMIFIPCHRVVGADGKLVGFGGGLDMKEQLLNLEEKRNDE